VLAQIEISNETTFEYEPEFDDDMDEYLGAPPNILLSLSEYIHADDFGKYSMISLKRCSYLNFTPYHKNLIQKNFTNMMLVKLRKLGTEFTSIKKKSSGEKKILKNSPFLEKVSK